MSTHRTNAYDVAVVGVGTMGSMALWRLARLGLRVVGIEQYGPAHTNGSFSGESRLYRAAAKEGQVYVPALLEARHLWRELEIESGRQVLLPVGALSIGPAGHPDLTSTMRSIDSYGLPHRVLDAAELRERYPQFAVRHDDIGIMDKLGGGLRPEVAVMTATASAVARGAEVRHHTQVLGVDEGRDGVTVTTATGTIRANRVVVTTGS